MAELLALRAELRAMSQRAVAIKQRLAQLQAAAQPNVIRRAPLN
jgi:hypothetical protein